MDIHPLGGLAHAAVELEKMLQRRHRLRIREALGLRDDPLQELLAHLVGNTVDQPLQMEPPKADE